MEFQATAKVSKVSLNCSVYIYSDIEVSPKAMNGLLMLGTPFGVSSRMNGSRGRCDPQTNLCFTNISLWQIKLVCLSRSVFHTTNVFNYLYSEVTLICLSHLFHSVPLFRQRLPALHQPPPHHITFKTFNFWA